MLSHAEESKHSDIPSVEDMARERQFAAEDLARAEAERDRLYGPYVQAVEVAQERRNRLAEIDQAVQAAADTHRVREALDAAGIAFDGPLVVNWEVYQGRAIATLVAVGAEGTGLYLHTPDKPGRYFGKERVIRIEDAARHGVTEEPRGGPHVGMTHSALHRAGLYLWQERTRGDFGRNGPYAPSPPPEGGRWRWLRIKSGKALEGAKR